MGHIYIIENENGYQFIDDKDKRKRTEEAVGEINRLSNLPCDLLKSYSKRLEHSLAKKGFEERIDNYMSTDFYGVDGMIITSGYPHDEEEDFVTSITLKTEKYDFLGIKVGAFRKQAVSVLISYGYCKIEEDDECYYDKDDVQIYFDGNEFLKEIRVEVKTFYVGNRIY